MKTSFVVIGVIVLALVAGFLFAVLPRGRIAGPVAPTPSEWAFVGSGTTCMLEFHAAAPRSVRVGCYPYEGDLYLHSHRWALAPRALGESWAQVVSQEPVVRLGLGGQIYELQATLVSDRGIRRRVLSARGFDPIPSGIRLFRLRARP